MRPLKELLSARSESAIQTLANYIQQHVREQWQQVLQENQEEFLRLYDKAGEPAYGTFALKLFRPVRVQLESAGFLSEPGFPGTLSTSLERGPSEERERWMWSVMSQSRGAQVGTIVVRLFHDHTRFRVPRPPGVFALEETDADAITRAVSQAAGHRKSGEG